MTGDDLPDKPHRCDETCICPVHGTPLIYWPADDDHACQDVNCEFGHGMNRHSATGDDLDRHFLSGCPVLTPRQLRQHRAEGTCTDCSEAGRLAREEDERRQAEYDRYAYPPGPGVQL